MPGKATGPPAARCPSAGEALESRGRDQGAPRHPRPRSPPWPCRARLTRAALCYAIAVGLVAVAPAFPAAVTACVLAGTASITFLTTGNSIIQLASEPGYRGRVTALWSMALVGSTPIGAPIIGALSDAAGPRYALGLGAAACLAAAAIGRWPTDSRFSTTRTQLTRKGDGTDDSGFSALDVADQGGGRLPE